MNSNLYSFIDIFNSSITGQSGEEIQISKIMIPIIQRDYAQGRRTVSVDNVRSMFLESLYGAIIGTPINLDFVYGKIDEKGVLTPLDGQQRLTTLFLLHWYAAKKACADYEDYSFLKNFSYETRFSARSFCNHLVDFQPNFKDEMSLSEQIINAVWFPLDWKNDPTINSMLVMIDAIATKFADVDDVWEKLKNKSITFYFLPLDDMGLTDELYIKMNSRGKPLNQFEHFKAMLEHEIRKYDIALAERITKKIDANWTDMLWSDRGDNNITDDEFLRYFHFVCDIICYKENDSPNGKNDDEFALLEYYFLANDSQRASKNIQLLEMYYDIWHQFADRNEREEFFKKFISYKHETGKILFESNQKIDIFEDCIRDYADVFGDKHRQFTIPKIVLLFAFVTYLLNKDIISEENFRHRIRVVHNLVRNSADELRDKAGEKEGNHMPAILQQVESIIINGNVIDNVGLGFNVNQLNEEKEKIAWLANNESERVALYELEDHPLLNGQIGIVGIEHPEYFARFTSLFECDWDNVDCALMSIGFYPQQERNNWRFQFGSSKLASAWRELFHKSANKGYDNTKKCLAALLDKYQSFTDADLLAIKDAYLKECDDKKIYEWRYYYVKYPVFRPGKYGKYYSLGYEGKDYDFLVMETPKGTSSYTYQPFMRQVAKDFIAKGDYGQYAVIGDKTIYMDSAAFVILRNDEEIGKLCIKQWTDEIDREDRIQKYQLEIGNYLAL